MNRNSFNRSLCININVCAIAWALIRSRPPILSLWCSHLIRLECAHPPRFVGEHKMARRKVVYRLTPDIDLLGIIYSERPIHSAGVQPSSSGSTGIAHQRFFCRDYVILCAVRVQTLVVTHRYGDGFSTFRNSTTISAETSGRRRKMGNSKCALSRMLLIGCPRIIGLGHSVLRRSS